ncbi:MAG: YbhB/YbcL family Raf kinase inhibitor-like protein [Propionibacteriaceae bacterium]|jgi:Raf kinase inhibitor-like YbhB/YbcL family protein|nr:YbhB/YbcL family Raf kinase inhibitor-like protein [Propionibacteriaceae bacterium]
MDLKARTVAPDPYDLLPDVPSFILTSVDISDGVGLPDDHVAAGANLSPALKWSGFPADTKSFLVNCFDPDAPTPAGYWHWTVVDLPATVTCLPRGVGQPGHANLPDGAFALRNDSGDPGYLGAAPPPGDRPHRYIFAVHALAGPSLGLTPAATCTTAAFTALFSTIARARLTALYQR